MSIKTWPVTALLSAALVACAVTTVETPDPAAVPTGSFQAPGNEPTGPIVEIGSGQALGFGWRYAIYPSADGWCSQLETASLVSAGCGDLLPAGDEVFGSVSVAQLEPDGITTVDGIVTSDVATVWMISEGNLRAPATDMSAEPADLEVRAFVGFAPRDVTITHLQAVAGNGEILDTYELP